MPFTIVVKIPLKLQPYKLEVDKVYSDQFVDRYQVAAGGHTVMLESNLPTWRSKGRDFGAGNWQQVAGRSLPGASLDAICVAIDRFNYEKSRGGNA